MMIDEDMPEALHNWLLCQNREKLLEVMFEALDLMQQYNGRSHRYCIATAAGFEVSKDGNGWKIPKMTPPIVPGGSYWLNCAKADVSRLQDHAHKLLHEPVSLGEQVDIINGILSCVAGVKQRIQEHEENAK